MIADIGEVFSAQKDGTPPSILASGCAPGESGVSVVSLRYKGSAHFRLICGSIWLPSIRRHGSSAARRGARCITTRMKDPSRSVLPDLIPVPMPIRTSMRFLLRFDRTNLRSLPLKMERSKRD